MAVGPRTTAGVLAQLHANGVPDPDDTPSGRLAHTVAVYNTTGEPAADKVMVVATAGIYPDHPGTGVTYGDLKQISASLHPAYMVVHQVRLLKLVADNTWDDNMRDASGLAPLWDALAAFEAVTGG